MGASAKLYGEVAIEDDDAYFVAVLFSKECVCIHGFGFLDGDVAMFFKGGVGTDFLIDECGELC